MKKSYAKGLMLGICLLAAGICYCRGYDPVSEKEAGASESGFVPGSGGDELLPGEGEVLPSENVPSADGVEVLPGENVPGTDGVEVLPGENVSGTDEIYVHICGEVRNPGVYRLREGDRICRAVELAGGFTEQAAQAGLNLAQKVSDGMKIAVPSEEEWSRMEAAGQTEIMGQAEIMGQSEAEEDGRVDLNTAGREELMTLPGIGRVRAEEILRYRQEQGPFQQAEDVMKVPGIKAAVFEKIRDAIVVRRSDR